MATVQTVEMGGWKFFLNPETEETTLHNDNCGKWMYFFDTAGMDFAEEICQKTVRDGAAAEAKHTDNAIVPLFGSGVCCFYCDGSSIEQHRKIISFFIKNKMIRKI